MADHWIAKLDTYLDGELPADEMRELDAHLRGCSPCAADVLSRLQMKRAVHSAGMRYRPSADFREHVRKSIAAKRRQSPIRMWAGAGLAVAMLLLVGFVSLVFRQGQIGRQQTFSELADLHVATLASANPVDVISTDRHTVKPWFQGKLPFTFNLPELQNSPFKLIGGRVTYFEHSPVAQLLFQIRSHQLSVFIFQDQPGMVPLTIGVTSERELAFNVDTWSDAGLRYVVVGDASPADIHALGDLMRSAK